MAKNKTVETEESVKAYIDAIQDDQRRKDFNTIVKLVSKHTNYKAKMWGLGIVGFGSYDYKYESGREGSAPLFALSSRVNAISLYYSSSFPERETLLKKFGKFKSAKACIYIQKLEDVDPDILLQMVDCSINYIQKIYPKTK